MAIWKIPVRWECGGTVLVEAPTLEKAAELAQEADFPDEDWRDDEVYVEDETDEYIRKYDNNDQPDEEITAENEIYSPREKVKIIATGEIVTVYGRRVVSDGTVIYGCKSDSGGTTIGGYVRNEARFHMQEYTKKELRRAEIESTQT